MDKETRLITEDSADLAQDHAWRATIRLQALERLARPPSSRSRWIAVLAVLIVLHGMVFWRWYRSRFPVAAVESTILEVRLIDEPAPSHALSPQVAPPRHIAAAILPAPPASPPPASVTELSATARPQLFERDGSVRLVPQARFVSPHETGIARGRELLARGHNLIHCRRSKFDDSPTPAEMANAAAGGAHMAHLVMGNPLDPLNDVGEQQAEDAAGEHAAEKRRIEEQACDY